LRLQSSETTIKLMILVTNPEDLDRIEDLWVLWKEDADRLSVADRKSNSSSRCLLVENVPAPVVLKEAER
jgi:hypothetical protein